MDTMPNNVSHFLFSFQPLNGCAWQKRRQISFQLVVNNIGYASRDFLRYEARTRTGEVSLWIKVWGKACQILLSYRPSTGKISKCAVGILNTHSPKNSLLYGPHPFLGTQGTDSDAQMPLTISGQEVLVRAPTIGSNCDAVLYSIQALHGGAATTLFQLSR